jgi:hypothetical protein
MNGSSATFPLFQIDVANILPSLANTSLPCWPQTNDFVIIVPTTLLRRLDAIHSREPKTVHSCVWVT